MIKKLFCVSALALTATQAPQASAAEFAFSFAIGQAAVTPGVDASKPPAQPVHVVYTKPLTKREAPARQTNEEVHLRVPVYHASNWERYCHRYDACGYPVRFVPDGWYQTVYVTRYENGRYSTFN